MTTPTPPPYPTPEVVCYRHHDRRAGVSCQRCSRPICPACMVSASVGFQCPECTRSGAAASRSMSMHDLAPTSYLTLALIGINVAIFLIDLLGAGVSKDELYRNWVLYEPLVNDGEWWRLITGGFLHANLMHLAFNMFALYSIGTYLERVVGTLKYALIYAVSLLGGSLGVVLLSTGQPTVGASGAIFGIFGAFAVLSLSRGISPMASGIGSTILLNLFITFAVPGISIGGHLGGLVAGGACGALLFGTNPQQARDKQRHKTDSRDVAIIVGLGVLCFAAALALSSAQIAR
ncbi:MAG: rhomboid family intramembrane serine protease [Actinobacteria bacterium]|nr:rhomboid family intramembrane serine protease [Actinomycetota bacterium]